jgi:hypothetical protein
MNAVMKLYAWPMKMKVALLSALLLISSISDASARCYTDDCVEDRINSFFLFLPLMVWGFIVWAQEDSIKSNPEKYPNAKKLQSRLMYVVTFIIAWLIMGWML